MRDVRSNPTTLPVEIITDNESCLLEVSIEILNMRQTCKQIEAISKTRSVWLGQYHQYLKQRISPTRLEEPPSSYSMAELERWVLLRRSADAGWKRQDMKFTRKRWMTCKEAGVPYIDGASIIPGGRWLLVGGGDGSVTTFDLDASTLKGSPLISPTAEDKQPVHHFAIDIDWHNKASNLTFTMALSAPDALYFTGSPHLLKFNHIWQVSLTGHNTEARLTPDHLRTIQAHDDSCIEGVVLYKNVFERIHHRRNLSYIEVFDWEQSASSKHCKAIIFPEVPIGSIRLLPGDRLLAFSETHMMIYPFKIVVRANSDPPTPHICEPLWKLPFIGAKTLHGALSRGLFTEVATYFIVKVKALGEIAIPHDERQAPSVRELMVLERPKDLTYAIGFEKTFIQHADHSTVRLSCAWDTRGADEDE